MSDKKTSIELIDEYINKKETELDLLISFKKELLSKEKEIVVLNKEVTDLKEILAESESPDDMNTIDFGIGTLRYVEPDNLALQSFMEELKEKYEKQANFGQLKLVV